MLNAEIKSARITLFEQTVDIKKSKQEEIKAGKYPLFQGNLEIGPFDKKPNEKYPSLKVAAYRVPGNDFLSLSLQVQEKQGDDWIVVQEFRGTLNKGSNETKYFGYIHQQIVTEENGKKVYSKGDWELGFNATGYPRVVENGEVVKKFFIKGDSFWNTKKSSEASEAEEFPDLDY